MPNLAYALRGYHAFRANPFEEGPQGDPGFASPIFETRYSGSMSSDLLYQVPDGLFVFTKPICSFDFSSELIRSMDSFTKVLMKYSSTEAGFDLTNPGGGGGGAGSIEGRTLRSPWDAHFEEPNEGQCEEVLRKKGGGGGGGGGGGKGKDKDKGIGGGGGSLGSLLNFGFNFQTSGGYNKQRKNLEEDKYNVVQSTAGCGVYEVVLDTIHPPPFTDGFMNALRYLDDVHRTPEDYLEFVEEFGTHFFNRMTMGARFTHLTVLQSSTVESLLIKDVELEVGAEASILIGGANVNMDLSIEKEHAKEY